MKDKAFKLSASQIESLVPNMYACFATDRIMVDGAPVGFMYREEPEFPEDSGWRFFAGDESEEYVDNPDVQGIYAVNTVANYDQSIIPLLNAAAGAAFIRNPQTGELVPDDGSV